MPPKRATNGRIIPRVSLIENNAYSPYASATYGELGVTEYRPLPDHPSWDQWYAQSNTSEPLSDDMSRLLRRELEDLFYEHAATHRRLDQGEFRPRWKRDPAAGSMAMHRMLIVNELQADKTYFNSNYWHLKPWNTTSTRVPLCILLFMAGSPVSRTNYGVATYFVNGIACTADDRRFNAITFSRTPSVLARTGRVLYRKS